ncbi:MAG: ROK family protein, partial [Brachybacterium sp.]|nr:ROK family protein [Brachybacterium sp.]
GTTVVDAPNLGWSGVALEKAFGGLTENTAQALPIAPVRAVNDTRLAARVEIEHRPGSSFLYLRGETGIGGAVVLDGTILGGENGWAGEIGHVVISPDGPTCRCGRRGCVEAYASHHALRASAGLSADVPIEDLIGSLSAAAGGRAAVIDQMGRPLGLALAGAMNVLDLSTVVLGGYLGEIATDLAPVLTRIIGDHALAAEGGTIAVLAAEAPGDSALDGAVRTALAPVLADPAAWISSRDPAPVLSTPG